MQMSAQQGNGVVQCRRKVKEFLQRDDLRLRRIPCSVAGASSSFCPNEEGVSLGFRGNAMMLFLKRDSRDVQRF